MHVTHVDPALAARNRQAAEAARRRDRTAEFRRVRAIAEGQASPVEPVRLGRDVETADWRDPDDTNPNRREPRRVRGHKRIDVLTDLMHRGTLSRLQVAAGFRLRDDCEIADGAKPGSERSEIRGGGARGGPEHAQLAAMARYRNAVRAIGPILSGVVVHVVLRNRSLSEWIDVRRAEGGTAETRYAVAKRARAQLIDGMDRLEAHYGDGLTHDDEARVEV